MRTEQLDVAREHLDELADEVASGRGPVTLARPGHDDVALVSVRELRSLEDTAALAADPDAAREIAESLAQARRGEFIDVDAARAQLGLPPLDAARRPR